MHVHTKEVDRRIASLAKDSKEIPASIFKTAYVLDGYLPMPAQRAAFGSGYSFSGHSIAEQKKIWLRVWRESDSFLVKHQSLFFLEKHFKESKAQDWSYLKRYMPQVDNWAYADFLAKLYAAAHNAYPTIVRPDLLQWRRAKNPWLRRQSLTCIFYYSQLRTPPHPSFPFCSAAVQALLKDDHYYVQKGVGWLLREMFNVYPKETYELLLTIASRIPPAGWQAATEKLSPNKKSRLKKLRTL